MNIFIIRPIMTTLVMAAILLFGSMGYRRLPVNDLPTVDFPTILVSASLPGASPETMASAVATPLEKQFTTIAGLDNMTSSSGQGVAQITLQFNLNRNIDAAAQDVQSAIAAVQRQLPPDMPTPPSYQKVNPADQPILFIALTSPTLPLSTLTEYGETVMAQKISTVDGVAQVQIFGSQKYAVRIQLDPRALASRGLGIDEVMNAVQVNNANLPTGTLWGPYKALNVQADGQLSTAAEYGQIVVAYRNGAPVRLQDLGRVVDSVQNNKVASWFKDTRAVMLAVQRQPGVNTVQVADAVRALLPTLRKQIPASMEVNVMFDRSESIRASVRDVKFTLVVTLFLVVMVIFLFLRNASATFIPSMALPMSVVGTFAVMYLMGFSLDNLSLMALTLAVGFVVDDAVVMLENIVRHFEMGKSAFKAASDGAREVAFTIVSMTLSLTAVFIPLLFMGGIVGRLFHEFGVVIGAAILVSGAVSLSLTPMMSSRFLRPPGSKQHGHFYVVTEGIYNGFLKLYEDSLAWVMRHRFGTLVFSLLILVGSGFLFGQVQKGFLPSQDNDALFGNTEAAEGTSFDNMVEHQQAVAAILAKDPNVDSFMSAVGSAGLGAAPNQGRLFVHLKPRSQRRLSAAQVVQSLRPSLSSVPGMRVVLNVPPPINIGGRIASALYQFTLQSPNWETLQSAAVDLEAKIRQIPLLQDVNSDLRLTSPEVDVSINRDLAASLGISPQRVEDALFSAYGSRQVSTILAPNNQYYVIMELLPEYQRDPTALSLLYLRSNTGKLVPLNALAKITQGVGPLTVNHSGQLPSVTISFNVKPDAFLGQAVAAVEATARQTLPSSITTSFSGTAQAFKASLSGLALLLLLSVLVIYGILGILYESFIHPITILTGLPFAGFGALLTLLVFRVELNLYSIVGLIMLIGVVKKNAIMMVDFALDAQRHKGLDAVHAILDASRIRFRPIMMTTFAALFATLPIALGFGAGSEARRPLGLAVVGGLVFSQFITLYVTPVFYTYFDALQTRIGGLFTGRKGQGSAEAALSEPAPMDESVPGEIV